MGEEVVAGSLAPPADFGAQAAVLVMGRVQIALFGAGEARLRTRLDDAANQANVRRRLPRCDVGRRLADVGAVEANADDPHELW